MTVPLIDVLAHRAVIGSQIDASIAQVVEGGNWIMGPECGEFEAALTRWIGLDTVSSIGCSNGTDALVLAFQALGLRSGQGVIVPAFTFVATAEAVAVLGAVPIFADVDGDTFNLSADSAREAAAAARSAGVEVVGIVAVDLFGQPAQYGEILSTAEQLGCWVVADAAQSFGAAIDGKRVGSLADVTTTSFFPAKPLGCYGDGGAVFTERADVADRIRSLRVHGKGSDKYDNVLVGQNARLDTLQAAILIHKLEILDFELVQRQKVADRYTAELADAVTVPSVRAGHTSAWAQYTVMSPRRSELQSALAAAGIGHAVYYPKPLHLQTAYEHFETYGVDLAVSERLSNEVISIPMYPYLSESDQSQVIETIVDGSAC